MRNNFYTMLVAFILYSIGTNAQFIKESDSIKFNQYGQEVSYLSLNGEAREGILSFTSGDGNYLFWMDNRLQFDMAAFSTDTYNPIGNGAEIRRARFAVKAILYKNWYGELDLDFAGSKLELKDAYIKYTFDSGDYNIKVGHFRESFGMETLTSSRYVVFMERSLISKMDASRSLGMQANHWADRYSLSGGIHFGNVGELEETTYAQDKNKDFGIDDGYSFTGRAVYRPIVDDEKVLHLGLAGTYRTPKTSAEFPDSFRFSTRTHSNINRKKYIDTDDILEVDYATAIGLELAGAYKGFMFQSEYKNTGVTRKNDLESATFDGWYAQAGYLLFGGQYNYARADGEFTRIQRGKSYGELEAVVRYDYVNANDFDAEIYGGSADGIALGLNYHFNANVRFMLNYAYNNHDRFANGKGKLYVGHDSDGNLTKDPFAVVESDGDAGEDFSMISCRFEITF